jgi:Flp pilus assembly protein TadD
MKKAIVIVLLVLVATAGFWLGREPYRRWKQDRFLTEARGFLAKSDYHKAAFSARKTLEVNPTNTDACRIMAKISERVSSAEAVAWDLRVAELQPAVSNQLELARVALLFANYPMANHALLGVKESDRNTVAYQSLVSIAAAGEGDLAAAELHAGKAIQLEPTNKVLQLNLAVLRLQSKDQRQIDAARETLEQLRSEPMCRREALHQLVLTWLKSGDFSKAELYSRKLQLEKPPIFEDNLLHLSVLKGLNSAEAGGYLASLEKTAAKTPQDLNALAAWLDAHRMTDEALYWLQSLSARTPPDRLTTELIADCYDKRGDWAREEGALKDQNWGELDYIRHAKLAHAFRKQKNELQADADWHTAITAASGQLKPLSILLSMAGNWGWNREQEEVAWLILKRFPGERRVLEMLKRRYAADGNTLGLQKVYAMQIDDDATDTIGRNNFAALSLLLHFDVPKACEVAHENYIRSPGDVILASTYAFALYQQGRTKEGLDILEKFKTKDLQKPAVATYYGVMLAAAGEKEKAKPYLDIAARSALLPEERTLLSAALDTRVPAK